MSWHGAGFFRRCGPTWEWRPSLRWPHLFSTPIQDFASAIAAIKGQREEADYNPGAVFTQSQVITWIDRAEQAIRDFSAAPPQERSMAAIATLAR